MDTLQILVDMVKELPQTALWVLIGFFIYKSFIIGSIYGLARFGIKSMADCVKNWRQPDKPVQTYLEYYNEIQEEHNKIIENQKEFEDLYKYRLIGADMPELDKQISRIAKDGDKYIFERDILWLKELLDENLPKRNK